LSVRQKLNHISSVQLRRSHCALTELNYCNETVIKNMEQVRGLRKSKTKSPAIARVGSTVRVVTDLEGQLRSMIFNLSERAYATSC